MLIPTENSKVAVAPKRLKLLALVLVSVFSPVSSEEIINDGNFDHFIHGTDKIVADEATNDEFAASKMAYTIESLEKRIQAAKLELWSRGAFALDEHALYNGDDGDDFIFSDDYNRIIQLNKIAQKLEWEVSQSYWTLGPVLPSRRDILRQSNEGGDECIEFECDTNEGTNFWGSLHNGGKRQLQHMLKVRGGGNNVNAAVDYNARLEKRLNELGEQFGSEFKEAIEKNKFEHASDCEESCKYFYCADDASSSSISWDTSNQNTTFLSLSFGGVPPEDFSEEFGFPLDLIKVTEGEPLFSAEEAAKVVQTAEEEGVDKNEYQSGKYKLGGDWLLNLPKTRAWFNDRLENTFFPLLSYLFPEIISSPSVLRAHSVSLLKYNSSHPRTDVHIDNGILAMTLAMTKSDEYTGGGTFFEHMGTENVLHMDVGHGTFRPGSVRHGGHRVRSGTRYILGAFLLLYDRVEHVRRLKNRGSELRRSGDLDAAEKHFEWALAINPKCTTCLKDWAEVLLTKKKFADAERHIRRALELLEERDSDALFTLGLLLSEQGRDEESIEAYKKSVSLNAEDAELCYNLGIKLGARGDVKGEMAMYARATRIDPTMGGAWLNWGTSLAEGGNMEDAEVMFLKGLQCGSEVKPKALMNLALVYQSQANSLATGGDLAGAKTQILKASKSLDEAKSLLDQSISSNSVQIDSETKQYISKYAPLRLQCHRLTGQIMAGMGDYGACEEEFRRATENFPNVPGVWEMLARILDLQGKSEEAMQAKKKVQSLGQFGGSF